MKNINKQLGLKQRFNQNIPNAADDYEFAYNQCDGGKSYANILGIGNDAEKLGQQLADLNQQIAETEAAINNIMQNMGKPTDEGMQQVRDKKAEWKTLTEQRDAVQADLNKLMPSDGSPAPTEGFSTGAIIGLSLAGLGAAILIGWGIKNLVKHFKKG